jgi:hypothetical protein
MTRQCLYQVRLRTADGRIRIYDTIIARSLEAARHRALALYRAEHGRVAEVVESRLVCILEHRA